MKTKKIITYLFDMDAKELRIGNYIFDNEKNIAIVNGFRPYDHSVRCDEEEGCELLIDFYNKENILKKGYLEECYLCSAILLSEEWLLNFGFEKIDHHRFKIITSDIAEFYYTYSIHDNCFRYYLKDVIICISVLFEVHQLQNLYFALNGKELTIK